MTIIVLLFFVPVLVGLLLGLNLLFAAHRPYAEKVSAYECGMPIMTAQTRNPFSVSYYLVGILFLLFDLEIALVYPIAVTLGQVGVYGYWIVTLFFALLTLGFAYEWSKGSLKWTDHRSQINRHAISPYIQGVEGVLEGKIHIKT